MVDPGYADELRELGLAAGLDRVGFATAEAFDDTRVAIESRKAAGLHGSMQFTYRNPRRSTDPDQALPGVQTLVVAARAYPSEVSEPGPQEGTGPLARVARYATDDHYAALRSGLDVIAERLRTDGWRSRVVLDDNALVDRAAAHRAGIGWYGKNANILVEGLGSWFVLGSVLTDAPLVPPARAPIPMADGCGGCTRCLTACPTGAIVEPGVVDARRCLAWLVQAEGVFPIDHREALGDRIYGCDVCQEVCPPSIRTTRLESSASPESAGSPPGRAGGWVPVLDLLRATDADLLATYGRWYVPRRDPRYLRRNALIVLGNAAPVPVTADVADLVASYIRHTDPLLRAHAIWTAKRLGLGDLVAGVRAGLRVSDPDGRDSDHDLERAELAAEVVERAGSFAS